MKRLKHLAPLTTIILWEIFALSVSLHYGDTLYNYKWWETSLAVFLIFLFSLFALCYWIGTRTNLRFGLFLGWLFIYSALTFSLQMEGVALGLFFTPTNKMMKENDIRIGGSPYPDEMYSDIKWGFQDYGTAVRRWQRLRYEN